MPAEMDTEEQQEKLVMQLDPDLAGLLQCKEVALKVQAMLAAKKVKTVSRLAALADDRKGLREFCVKTLALDPDTAGNDVETAAVVDAWESARVRVEARNKAEAEAVIGGLPKVVPRTEVAQLRERFEAAFYALPDKVMPATATLEQHFDMIDHGEYQYLSLKEYASKEDAAQEDVAATIDRSTGTIKVKKGHVQVPLPSNAEELRSRLRLVAHSFVFCSLRYPRLTALQGVAPYHFQNYADFLLGDFVFGLHATDAAGGVVSSPAFDLVIAYEFQLRKNVMKLLNAGGKLVSALEKSMADMVIKERYFVTPSALRAMMPPPPPPVWGGRERSRSRGRRGGGKGKGKGKGKVKFVGDLKKVTEEGVQMCFKFNNAHEKCRGPCDRAHVCQLCLGKHPMHACPAMRAKSAEEASAGKE